MHCSKFPSLFDIVKFMKVVANRLCQEEIMKACHQRIDLSQESMVFAGHFGRENGGHGRDKVVFPTHLQICDIND